MLIDNQFQASDIIVMRITGGDEVIARFISQDDKGIKVSKPLALTVTQQGLGMTQYLMMGDMTKDFTFNKNAIITVQKANKQAADNYIKGTDQRKRGLDRGYGGGGIRRERRNSAIGRLVKRNNRGSLFPACIL